MQKKTGVILDQVVGAVVTHFRVKVAQLSQQQAVEGLSIGTSSLSRLEKGDYSLNMGQLFELSSNLGVTMTQIINSIEKTCDEITKNGIYIAQEKKTNTKLLLLSTDSIAQMVQANLAQTTELEKSH